MVMLTVRADLSRIQRTNLETCITVHMHQKESTEDLVRRKVRTKVLGSPPHSMHSGLIW
jgi:dynein heavy chain